jgi:hypothetical protein
MGPMRRATAAAAALAALTVLGGCGDDDAPPPPPRGVSATPTPAATPGAAGANKTLLAEKQHIEERVSCPIPDRPTDAKDGKCDPKAPSCDEHLYCLHLAQGYFCEPCPERDAIRHNFKQRDFVAEQNRDPFQSFLLPQIPTGKTQGVPIDPTKKCLRDDQMVATSYSYADLKLVGIVAIGTQRKVLMMGGPLGYIIKRGDCVGKEKAVVKDIGTSYITFQVDPDAASLTQRAPQEVSVQINPKQLTVGEQPSELPAPRTTIAPVVGPPAVLPPRSPPPAGSGSAAPVSPSAPRSPPVEAPPVQAPPVAPKKP